MTCVQRVPSVGDKVTALTLPPVIANPQVTARQKHWHRREAIHDLAKRFTRSWIAASPPANLLLATTTGYKDI
jgi:hypothetical protein